MEQQTFFDLNPKGKQPEDSSFPIIPDKEGMWTLISKRLESDPNFHIKPVYHQRTKIFVTAIAASIALLIGIGGTVFYQQILKKQIFETSVTEVRCPKGHKTQVFLPDGTSVWLNSGTDLKYDAVVFNQKERKVELKGEAFFEVTKNAEKKFTVDVSGVEIQVFGTSFDISAYEDDSCVKVSLLEGSVSLSDQHSGKFLGRLSPDQMAIVNKQNSEFRIVKDNAALTCLWTQNVLRIYNEDIRMASKKLERWYGVNIHIENLNQKPHFSFVVKTESLRELLQLLNKITPIKYTIKGEEVYISNK